MPGACSSSKGTISTRAMRLTVASPGAPGEIRTHTGPDLNRLPLPLGYGRAPTILGVLRGVEAEVAPQLAHVAGGLDVVLRQLDLALPVDDERRADHALD